MPTPTSEQIEKARIIYGAFGYCYDGRTTDGSEEPYGAWALAIKAAEALTAAEVKPRIKPLEWCGDSDRYAYSDVTSKAYLIAFEEGVYWASWDASLPPFDTITEAKSAAQADYEARILSALEGE